MIARYYLRGFVIGIIFECLMKVKFEFLPLLILILLVIAAAFDVGADIHSRNWSPKFRITGRPLMFLQKLKKLKNSKNVAR